MDSPSSTSRSCISAIALPARRRSALITTAVVVLVVGMQWLALQQYRAVEASRSERAFARTVDQATVSLMQQTVLYQNAVLGLRAHYLGSDEVTTSEFARYARALEIEQSLPGLRAFAFNREVAEDNREAYVAWVRKNLSEYDPAYASFDIYPVEPGHTHHVVEAIHPPLGNQRSLGYDLMSSEIRRLAIVQARSHGFAATPPIRLQQAPNAVAMLILAPVSTPGWNGQESGQQTVAASFLVNDLINTAIAPALRRRFHLQIVDLGSEDDLNTYPTVLFEDQVSSSETLPYRQTLHRTHIYGGRRWDIRFTPRDPELNLIPIPVIVFLMLGGALMAGTITHLGQQRIRRAARNQALANQALDCVLEIDADGVVSCADASTARITGLSQTQWEGSPLWDSVVEEDTDAVRTGFAKVVAEGVAMTLECRLLRPGEEPRWIEIRLANQLKIRTIGAVLAQISDINARKQAEAEIARLAFFDPLTKLPNRRLLEQRAEMTFSAARRHRGRAALLVIDLDGFKQINDNAGHATGDTVLATVAHRLQQALRDSDTVARLGGDEFVILLGQPANEVDVRAAAGRLTRDLALPLNVDGRNWFVRASIGMAMFPDHGTSFAELLSRADAAMYRSKRSGSGLNTMASAAR
ncbi:MAG: diguanylate cyclase [Azoarcus sp.]|nr:diguanylate cyclase [Azoarcus sp.]